MVITVSSVLLYEPLSVTRAYIMRKYVRVITILIDYSEYY